MPAAASPTPGRSAAPARRAWIGSAVEEPLQVLGQLPRRRVALGRVACADRLEDDRLQVAGHRPVELARPRRLVVRDPLDQLVAVGVVERRPQRQQLVERQAQAVDVAAGVGLPRNRSGAM